MFVTFEGPEGAGKSTAIRAVAEAMQASGHDTIVTREPGAGEVGAQIRSILLHGGKIDGKTELFLFLADRSEHVTSIVRPALESGKVVLCDRFSDSTVVYQGHGRDLDLDQLRAWNDFATGGLRPDLTLLFDLPADQGLARLQDKDRLDAEPLEFHVRIREGFLSESAREPLRWRIIDAGRSPANVAEDAIAAIQEKLSTMERNPTR